MNDDFKEYLRSRGINPDRVLVSGRRVDGSPHGVTIELADGKPRYFPGPFQSVRYRDQIAITRWG